MYSSLVCWLLHHLSVLCGHSKNVSETNFWPAYGYPLVSVLEVAIILLCKNFVPMIYVIFYQMLQLIAFTFFLIWYTKNKQTKTTQETNAIPICQVFQELSSIHFNIDFIPCFHITFPLLLILKVEIFLIVLLYSKFTCIVLNIYFYFH